MHSVSHFFALHGSREGMRKAKGAAKTYCREQKQDSYEGCPAEVHTLQTSSGPPIAALHQCAGSNDMARGQLLLAQADFFGPLLHVHL